MDAVRLAFGTLTRLPVRPPDQITRQLAQPAMLLAPLTAVPLAVVWVILHLAARSGVLPSLLAASLVIAATAIWSRALHLDGLADTADGLGASYDRDRALDVMRRGDVGPMGVATLVLTLLVQVAALAALIPSAAGATLAVTALLSSRLAVPLGCWVRVPLARATGLGAAVGGSVSTPWLVAVKLTAVVLAVVSSVTMSGSWYGGALVLAGGLAAAAAVLSTAARRLDGVTGDVLGACVELALATGLSVGAVVLAAG